MPQDFQLTEYVYVMFMAFIGGDIGFWQKYRLLPGQKNSILTVANKSCPTPVLSRMLKYTVQISYRELRNPLMFLCDQGNPGMSYLSQLILL